LHAWGFTYKSNFVWVKDRIGTGYWNRNRHELLLVGTHGDISAPAPRHRFDSVIEAHRGRHSVKPFHFHEIIEDMFPLLKRVELFARTTRVGWAQWGNEVTDAA
jgi:N6-adenosine-specific RNA methylase IME4